MAHYVCNYCGAIFSENEAATETFRHTEIRPVYTEKFLVCPACLSSNYDDAAYCYRCKEPKRYEDLAGGYYCRDCMRELRNRYYDNRFINLNYDEYAEMIHELRSKEHTDEADPIDTMRGAKL